MELNVPDIENVLKDLPRITNTSVSLEDHHFIVLSQLNHWLENNAKPFALGILLDYGCGGQPYRTLFGEVVSRYIGADVVAAAGINLDVILTPGSPAPLPDASVDTILSTQTLEHVYDFSEYLDDCQRLLGQHGRLILSAPMQWRLHESPFDYWRFTRFGLEEKLRRAGFEIVEMQPCGGVFSLLGQIYLSHLSERDKLRPWLTRLINRSATSLDRRYPDADDTLLWMCLAKKA